MDENAVKIEDPRLDALLTEVFYESFSYLRPKPKDERDSWSDERFEQEFTLRDAVVVFDKMSTSEVKDLARGEKSDSKVNEKAFVMLKDMSFEEIEKLTKDMSVNHLEMRIKFEGIKNVKALSDIHVENYELEDAIKAVAAGAPIPKCTSNGTYPVRGDIVFAVRCLGLYKHYGIYIGNDEVVHFSHYKNESNKDTRIIKTSLQEFVNGDPAYIEGVEKGRPSNSNEETAKKAEKLIGSYAMGYSVIFHNCEHFANYCKYNENGSSQIGATIGKSTLLISALAGGPAALTISAFVYLFGRCITDKKIPAKRIQMK